MTTVVLGVLFALSLGLLACAVVLKVRNDAVYAYRQQLIAQFMRAAQLDILDGLDDWQWRADAYGAVTYYEMVWQFWRPLQSFYPDQRFTKPSR